MAISTSSDIQDIISSTLRKQETDSKRNEINKTIDKFKSEIIRPFAAEGTESLSSLNKISRSPWIITCDSWAQKDTPEYIVMFPNPKHIRWDFPFRKSQVKTVAGTVTFNWRDPTRGYTVFDEATIEITMQSGSLLPVLTTEGRIKDQIIITADRVTPNFPYKTKMADKIRTKWVSNDYKNSKGIDTFYKFLKLYNAPTLNVEGTGEPNYIRLILNTLLFPKLVLRGQFVAEESLSWEESADDPTQIEWTVKLIINKITPNIVSLSDVNSLLSVWAESGGRAGFRVVPDDSVESEIRNRIVKEIDREKQSLADRAEYDKDLSDELRRTRNIPQSVRSDAKKVESDTRKASVKTEEKSKTQVKPITWEDLKFSTAPASSTYVKNTPPTK